jgi:hypothetical protein
LTVLAKATGQPAGATLARRRSPFAALEQFSRSHGSLYKSLAEGQIDVDAL